MVDLWKQHEMFVYNWIASLWAGDQRQNLSGGKMGNG
jgi:hypothetical protein